MTVGEKIQYYRKKIGLSQEELGQKMLVSRQTVSLWEMDKTLPTVDNLIRLKEIFTVSIDDILSEAEPIEENKNEPKEAYVFKYEKSVARGLQKSTFSAYKTRDFFYACLHRPFCFPCRCRSKRYDYRFTVRLFSDRCDFSYQRLSCL